MSIHAEVIEDSITRSDNRLTTLRLRYPKFIHGEFMTHRVFSRNASSSRAIPVERLIQDVIDDTAAPVKWFMNKPGMQGDEEITDEEREKLHQIWLMARDEAVGMARRMLVYGAHKQHINRIIEPFCHINVVVTASEWDNFFALRDHPDAQPEIRVLAQCIKAAMKKSTPKQLDQYDWHLPFVTTHERVLWRLSDLIRFSVARCARVSYMTHDGKLPDAAKDILLHDRLVAAVPVHASPAEHQAFADDAEHYPNQWGNFQRWAQYRKFIEWPPNEKHVANVLKDIDEGRAL